MLTISKTVRASKKCSGVIFIEVDIRHRMAPRSMLHSVTLTFIFNVKHFSCYAFVIKNCAESECPRYRCCDSHGRRYGVALIINCYTSKEKLDGAIIIFQNRKAKPRPSVQIKKSLKFFKKYTGMQYLFILVSTKLFHILIILLDKMVLQNSTKFLRHLPGHQNFGVYWVSVRSK